MQYASSNLATIMIKQSNEQSRLTIPNPEFNDIGGQKRKLVSRPTHMDGRSGDWSGMQIRTSEQAETNHDEHEHYTTLG